LLYVLVQFRAYSFIGRQEIRENAVIDFSWTIDVVKAHAPYHVT